ncbi:MAG: ABC transporter permease [Angustibacter sp.]
MNQPTSTAPTTGLGPGRTSVSAVQPSTARLDRVMLAELTKLRSLRSTLWTLVILFLVTVGFAVLIAAVVTNVDPGPEQESVARGDNLSLVFSGLGLSQLAVAVLGVLMISSEYTTGGIRSTLTAVPQRLHLLVAKAVVLFGVTFGVGLVTAFTAFFVVQPILATDNLDVGIGDPQVLRSVVGGALYIAGSAMYGFAFGALIRKSAGAITTVVAVLLVLPGLVGLIPGSVGETIQEYFVSNAGQLITQPSVDPQALGPWVGYGVFTLEWLALLAVAGYLMLRRDA